MKFLITLLIAVFVQACPDNDELCVSCNTTQCLLCSNSYLDSTTGKCVKPSSTIQNCVQYLNEQACKMCDLGYYTTKDGQCAQIQIENCLQLRDANNCQVCNEKVLEENGKCNHSKKCKIENCDYCYFDYEHKFEKCHVCAQNYAVQISPTKHVCIEDNNETQNCRFLNTHTQNQCSICHFQTYFSNGRCLETSAQSSAKFIQVFVTLFMLLF